MEVLRSPTRSYAQTDWAGVAVGAEAQSMYTFEDLLDEQKQTTGRSQSGFKAELLKSMEWEVRDEALEAMVADGLLRERTTTVVVKESDEITTKTEVMYEFTDEAEERHVKWLVDGLSPLAQDALAAIRPNMGTMYHWKLVGPKALYEELGVTLTEMREAYNELSSAWMVRRDHPGYRFSTYGRHGQALLKQSLQAV